MTIRNWLNEAIKCALLVAFYCAGLLTNRQLDVEAAKVQAQKISTLEKETEKQETEITYLKKEVATHVESLAVLKTIKTDIEVIKKQVEKYGD